MAKKQVKVLLYDCILNGQKVLQDVTSETASTWWKSTYTEENGCFWVHYGKTMMMEVEE